MTTEDEYRAAESLIRAWDGWIDEPELDWGSLATFLCILCFMAISFCGGILLAFAWSLSR